MNAAEQSDTFITGPLYASRKKVFPQAVSGRFRRIKWAFMAFALGLYYLLPFVRWDRGAGAPNQAVLVDLTHRRFYFFFIELWPQEVYYFTGLLIVAAFTLFLMNAVAGRVWCGYMCPQTVWTDLFYAIERWVEGDRRDRMIKDKAGWSVKRARELGTKHFLWLMVALGTGGALVLYFDDAPTLVRQLGTFQASTTAYIWIGILTATTYLLAGTSREQVCVFMCPWPRIQAALTDEWALNSLLIAKTWCFADMGLPLRGLFLVLRAFGLFPPAKALSKTALRQAIGDAGFEIADERVFGRNPHGPYMVARKRST